MLFIGWATNANYWEVERGIKAPLSANNYPRVVASREDGLIHLMPNDWKGSKCTIKGARRLYYSPIRQSSPQGSFFRKCESFMFHLLFLMGRYRVILTLCVCA